MYELQFKYDFKTFGGKPKRDIEKIPECKINYYQVENDSVFISVMCIDKEIAEKLKHYFAIRFELFPSKEISAT